MPTINPSQLKAIYDSGFQGITPSTKEDHEYQLSRPTLYKGNPSLAGLGEGKLALPFLAALQLEQEFGRYEAQTTGDCFDISCLVAMSCGKLKRIADIKIGEYVVSAQGKHRRVTRTIKKPYNKKMIKITVQSYPFSTTATPDHKFLTFPNIDKPTHDDIDKELLEWKSLEDIEIGDYILLPKKYDEKNAKNAKFDLADYCIPECITDNLDFKKLRLEPVNKGYIRAKNGRTQIKRNIELNEKLAWLLGLYLAEGGIDGALGNERITFNLGSHEAILAEQTKQYFKDIFNVDAKVYQVPSKPSVIYVRVYNVIIANFFKTLCPGNTYDKNFDNIILESHRHIKLAFLKGWFDGDGCYRNDTSSAVSVSLDLVRNMFDLANSCGLKPRFSIRPEYENHKEAYNIHLDKPATQTLKNIESKKLVSCSLSKYATKHGIAAKVKTKEIVEPESDYVYCLEVEHDHSFIANGYGVSNCVSHSSRNAGMIDYCLDALFGESEYQGRFATENIYGARGHGGQGANCSTLAKYVSTSGKGGFLVRKKYSSGSNSVDLSVYKSSIGHNWGRTGTPSWLNEIADDNPAENVYYISNLDMARDALAAGFGLSVCSNYGFSNRRNDDGVASRSGSWSHAMAWIACDDTPWAHDNYGGPLFLVQNSWGMWNSGSKKHNQPDGSFWITSSNANGMVRSGASYAICAVRGIDRIIDKYTTTDYIMI